MSGQSVIAFAQRFAPRRVEQGKVIDVTPEINANDLEVLEASVQKARSQKVLADADLIHAKTAAERAQDNLNAAVDALEAELKERGSLCRR